MPQSATEPVTVQTILDYLARAIEEKLTVAPTVWIDAASKLNVLLGNEHDRLCEMEQRVAELKLKYLEADPKHVVSAAKSRIQATDPYKELHKQELLCKRVEEFIRLAKLRSRLLAEEMRG
jgi:oligoribonuclease (3'-5' exoribonuclease)